RPFVYMVYLLHCRKSSSSVFCHNHTTLGDCNWRSDSNLCDSSSEDSSLFRLFTPRLCVASYFACLLVLYREYCVSCLCRLIAHSRCSWSHRRWHEWQGY